MRQEVFYGEKNFLTEEIMGRTELITELRHEFDFICFCQALMNPYGTQATKMLDKFIALSLRKLLIDRGSILLKVCPDFRMPPLTGHVFDCSGENQDIRMQAIVTEIHVKKQKEWIPVEEWLIKYVQHEAIKTLLKRAIMNNPNLLLRKSSKPLTTLMLLYYKQTGLWK